MSVIKIEVCFLKPNYHAHVFWSVIKKGSMGLSPEAVIALVGVLVALPSALHVIAKHYRKTRSSGRSSGRFPYPTSVMPTRLTCLSTSRL